MCCFKAVGDSASVSFFNSCFFSLTKNCLDHEEHLEGEGIIMTLYGFFMIFHFTIVYKLNR